MRETNNEVEKNQPDYFHLRVAVHGSRILPHSFVVVASQFLDVYRRHVQVTIDFVSKENQISELH
jgi:hypothetical protein